MSIERDKEIIEAADHVWEDLDYVYPKEAYNLLVAARTRWPLYVALAEAVRGCDVETVGPNERQPFAGEAITMRYEDWKRVRDALRAIEKAR